MFGWPMAPGGARLLVEALHRVLLRAWFGCRTLTATERADRRCAPPRRPCPSRLRRAPRARGTCRRSSCPMRSRLAERPGGERGEASAAAARSAGPDGAGICCEGARSSIGLPVAGQTTWSDVVRQPTVRAADEALAHGGPRDARHATRERPSTSRRPPRRQSDGHRVTAD